MAVVVGLLSRKGGVGKSTLARALCAVVAHAGLKVRLADLDAQLRTVAEWERLRVENNAGPALDVHSVSSLAHALAAAAEDELLILDGPAGAGRRSVEIAKAADVVVQPTSGSLDDLRPAVIFFHDLVDAGVPKQRLAFAIARTLAPAEEEAAKAYLAKTGYAVLAGAIPERMAFRDAHNRGEAVTEGKRHAQDAQVDDLIQSLFKKVHALMRARVKRSLAPARTKEIKA